MAWQDQTSAASVQLPEKQEILHRQKIHHEQENNCPGKISPSPQRTFQVLVAESENVNKGLQCGLEFIQTIQNVFDHIKLKKRRRKVANQYVHKNWMFDYPASLIFIVSGSNSHTSDHCQQYEWKLQVRTLAAFLWESSFFISDKLRWWTSRCLCCSCILTEMASFSSCSWKK